MGQRLKSPCQHQRGLQGNRTSSHCGETSQTPPSLSPTWKELVVPSLRQLLCLDYELVLVCLCPTMGCGLREGGAHVNFISEDSELAPSECRWNRVKPN